MPNKMVKLDSSQLAAMYQEVRSSSGALGYICQLAKDNALTAEYATQALFVSQACLGDLSQLLGVPTGSATEKALHSRRLDAADARIRELEALLARGASAAAMGAALGQFARKLTAWWDAQGFGHLKEVSFSDQGACKVTLSGYLTHKNQFSGLPDSASSQAHRMGWFEELQRQGYLFEALDIRGGEKAVDCDSNRALLTQLVQRTFPSASILGFRSERHYSTGRQCIAEVLVSITDLSDIEQLDFPAGANEGG